MNALRTALLVIGVLAAIVALFGLTAANMTVYAIAGIGSALLAIAWGLLTALQDSEGN